MLTSRRVFFALACSPLISPRLRAAELGFPPDSQGDPKTFKKRNDRTVVAFWHFFPVSFDNKPERFDYYTQQLLTPDGERGKHLKYGGLLRDRPIPVDPIPLRDWRTEIAWLDIQFAIGAGIDAFIFNLSDVKPQGNYLPRLKNLQDASAKYAPSFKIAPCLDAVTIPLDTPPDALADELLPILTHNSALLSNEGKAVFSAFAAERWGADRWNAIIQALELRGVQVCFRPFFLDGGKVTPNHYSQVQSYGWWTGNYPESALALKQKASEAKLQGKDLIWSIWPQDFRPRSGWYAEARNSETFRLGWTEAIECEAEWVCIQTWNDYSESAHIRPSDGIQYAFSDINKYYSLWFKTGMKPAIENNVLFFFHRLDFTGSEHSKTGRPAFKLNFGRAPVDELEILSFLAEDGVLRIFSGEDSKRFEVSEGISSVRMPLKSGTQKAEFVDRFGNSNVALTSPFIVRRSWDYQDLTYRAGSSARLKLP